MTPSGSPYSISLLAVGSPDFQRRIRAICAPLIESDRFFTSLLTGAWKLVVSERPELLVMEIGISHSPAYHQRLKNLCEQVRGRRDKGIMTVAALMSPESLAYGGDLLFKEDESLLPSGLIDSFIAIPPGSMPAVPSLSEQVANIISLSSYEFSRRSSGYLPLPALGEDSWVHSLADPVSREIWMKWLPRYAEYRNENPTIIGETGTGKTRVASALHKLAGLKGKFISITPRDFSSSELVQAELFGAVEGAYTGAVEKWGLVKEAENGTLFIDELQSIDKELQGKLITFIENKVYRRVGSSETTEANVRFVFASNRQLRELLQDEIMRDDFAYRLERMVLELQPLRERKLDIASGLAFALAKIHRQRPYVSRIHGVNSAAYRLLFAHRWPGNLRQLENNTAQLCEIADMKGMSLIDEKVVIEVLSSGLAPDPVSAHEILSLAAEGARREALSGSVQTLDGLLMLVSQHARSIALELSGGDTRAAAALIGDHEELLVLTVERLLAEQAKDQ